MSKNKNFNINFNKTLKPILIGYAVVIAIGIIITAVFGVNLDINFKGGTRITYNYSGTLDESTVNSTVNTALGSNATVVFSESMAGNTQNFVITLAGNSSLDTETQTALTDALTKTFPSNSISLYESNSVSPSVAGSFFTKCIVAMILAGIIVTVYIGVRFRNIGGVSAAITAYVALILDCIVAFLACTSFGLPVDSNLIAVILTLLGYSLNDTIVIYDRIRESKKLYPKTELKELVNESINAVKVRTAVTTITTVIAVLVIVIVSEVCGLSTLRSFAIPMAFGLISGCVSSLFISAPLWAIWKKHSDAKTK